MRASSATSPCLWERGGCCCCCCCCCYHHYCMAVAFPQRMRRLSSCPPRNGSLSSAAVSVRSNARPLRVLLPPPYPTHTSPITVPARCTTRCCGEAKRHHIRLYHGWPAKVATCARALLARLPAQPCADLNTTHYLIPRGHQSYTPSTSLPPYNKSLLPGSGPRGLSLAVHAVLLALAGCLP